MKLEPSSTWGSAAWTGREWILQVFITRDGSPWTIDTDFVLKRWDPVTGHPRFRLDLAAPPERKRWAYTCALLPNERQIVVGGNDGDLSLHDIATGACLWNLEGTGERIRGRARHVAGIAVSRDGSFLVSAAVSERPPSLRVVDVQTGRERRRIEIDCGTQLALFPDAAHVLVDGQSVHAIETGEAVFRIPGFADIGAVSPDGLWIVNGSRDGALACWEVAKLRAGGTEPKWKSASRDDYPFPINRMAISRDGIVLFASSATGIATWRMGDGGRTGNIPFTGNGHLALTQDEAHVWGASPQSCRLRHLDLLRRAETRPVYDHEEEVTCLAFSPDGRVVASGGKDGSIFLRERASGAPRGALRSSGVKAVAFSSDGRFLLDANDLGGGIHGIATGLEKKAWPRLEELKRFTDCISSPDGAFAVFRDEDTSLLCWNLLRNAEAWRLPHAAVTKLTTHGPHIVGVGPRRIVILDPASGRTIAELPNPDPKGDFRVAFLADRHAFGIESERGLVVRELTTAKELAHFPGSENSKLVAGAPDRRHIVTASEDGSVRLWNAANRALVGILDLSLADDVPTALAFAPDSSSFAVGTMRALIHHINVPR